MSGRHARPPEAPQHEIQPWVNPLDTEQVVALPLTKTNYLYDYRRGDTNPEITAYMDYGTVDVPPGMIIYESVLDHDARGNPIPDGNESFQKTTVATGFVNRDRRYQTFSEADMGTDGQIQFPEVVTERLEILQDQMHGHYTDALLDRTRESRGVTNRPEHAKYMSSVLLNEVLDQQDNERRKAESQITEPIPTISTARAVSQAKEAGYDEVTIEVPVTEKDSTADQIPVHQRSHLQALQAARTIGQPNHTKLPNLGRTSEEPEVVSQAANASRLDRLRAQIANKRFKEAIVSGWRPKQSEPTLAERQQERLSAMQLRRQVQEQDTEYSQTPAEVADALDVLRSSSDAQAAASAESQPQRTYSSGMEPHASIQTGPRHRKQSVPRVASRRPDEGARQSHRGPSKGLFKRSTSARHSRT